MKELLYSEETYRIKGAVFNVYKEIGCGFLENVYEKALAVEFAIQEISFREQQPLSVMYKGIDLGLLYKPDFICFDKIIIELKAVSNLTTEHEAQLYNYLKITGMRIGLLVNFAHYPGVEIKRIII